MEIKNDLRIQRTYKNLTEAFIKLMSIKHYEDITINELCEEAMIRRTTFYKHFADKNEFFRFFVRQLQNDFEAKNDTSADFLDSQSISIDIINNVLAFLRHHEKLVTIALESNMLQTMLDILSEQITFDVAQKIKTAQKKGKNIPYSPEIAASIFTGGMVYTVRWWLVQKKPISEEKLIQEIGLFMAKSPSNSDLYP